MGTSPIIVSKSIKLKINIKINILMKSYICNRKHKLFFLMIAFHCLHWKWRHILIRLSETYPYFRFFYNRFWSKKFLCVFFVWNSISINQADFCISRKTCNNSTVYVLFLQPVSGFHGLVLFRKNKLKIIFIILHVLFNVFLNFQFKDKGLDRVLICRINEENNEAQKYKQF